jgi:hypothetical protein
VLTDIYKEFEQRFTGSWFSSGWVEVQPQKNEEPVHCRKDLQVLQEELQALKSDIENISFKELQLSNLAKFYQ